MDRRAVTDVLEQIASCLELEGENPFRVRAYRTAAEAIGGFSGDIAQGLESGALAELRGVGKGTLEVVRDLVTTGRSRQLDELRQKVPAGLVEMLEIPGLGVTKVRLIRERLNITTVADLEAAATDGRLAALPRFGQKTAENVLKGIARLRRSSGALLLHDAVAAAELLAQRVAALPGVTRVEIAGSVRRRLETARSVDLVATGDVITAKALVPHVAALEGASDARAEGDRVAFALPDGAAGSVTVAAPGAFGVAWVEATGAPEHWADLVARAAGLGNALDLRGRFPDEESVYRAAGLPWIPPELREDRGECEAAARGALPALVTARDLKGLLHCHSTWSDGNVSVADWAAAARAAGYQWIGLTDHSAAAAYAGGMGADDVPRQHAEIDAVNAGGGGARILKGIEADILGDGRLDYGPQVLDRFDFVIGSIHSRFTMTKEEMTARVVAALDDPHLTILGHPTGRILLGREPYALDVDTVLARAALRGVAIEINGDPHRLDLDWRKVMEARAAGILVAIGSDAHSLAGIQNVDFGLAQARKAWLEARHVLNALSADAFLAFARRRRG
ncbi:MAG TPA: PHP domain-containing protein [Gemmatimonadales bacterium]|nr:PHP domain-containing protein [Gemmatimonadales bacterium]